MWIPRILAAAAAVVTAVVVSLPFQAGAPGRADAVSGVTAVRRPSPCPTPTTTVTATQTATATETATATTTATATQTATETVTATSTVTATQTVTATATATATATGPASGVCTSPVYTSTVNGAMYSDGPYIVHLNGWNIGGYQVTQRLEVCSAQSWNAVITANNNNGDGAVKTYPNVHKDYHDWGTGYEPPLSNYPTLSSTFAAAGPDTGIYNIAFDIWLNGVGNGGASNREVMIWTDNQAQTPAGSRVASGVAVGGHTWDVWSGYSNHILSFVATPEIPSGTLDLRAMLDYLIAQGRLPATSTLGQIGYGVEVVSTNGSPTTFNFTDFSITDA